MASARQGTQERDQLTINKLNWNQTLVEAGSRTGNLTKQLSIVISYLLQKCYRFEAYKKGLIIVWLRSVF